MWINTWFTNMFFVGLNCRLRYHIAYLIHLVSVPQLIDFSVDSFVYSMIPSSSCMFPCGNYWVHSILYSSKLLLVVKSMHRICRLLIVVSYVSYMLIIYLFHISSSLSNICLIAGKTLREFHEFVLAWPLGTHSLIS